FEAAKKALADADLTGEDIDLILVATVTPDTPFPTVSCMLQERLGAKHAAAMDISAACAGFMYGVITGQQCIETDVYNLVLVSSVDKLSKITEWTDSNACVVVGDGAGAAILSKVSDNRGILSFELGSDGSGGEYLYQNDENYLVMHGSEGFN